VTAAAPQLPGRFAPGDKLDRYELLCPIAEGGMASVWVARLVGKYGFEKLVAIKTILPRYATNTRFREMFLDEARIASHIEHPNVAQILDLGEERELLYLVLEYVDGDALSKLSRSCQKRSSKIPLGILLRVLADACAGLHEAHELRDPGGNLLGTVHRDISPHNILVSTKGIVKLIDFGIAKTESSEPVAADLGVLKGKIRYMAPEQALGRPTDRRADVWAVGAILHHFIAGKPPYEGDSDLTTLHLLGSGLPPSPLPHDVHPAVAAVVHKALAPEPAKRYATAAELREAIERAMHATHETASSSDVAAFSALHLGERARRRRIAIEHAVAAVTDRAHTSSSAAQGDAPFPAATVPPGGRPMFGSSAGLAGGTPRPPASGVESSPGHHHSYATLGAASLTASTPPPRPAANRRPAIVVGAFIVGFAGAAGASITMLRPERPLAASRESHEAHEAYETRVSAGTPGTLEPRGAVLAASSTVDGASSSSVSAPGQSSASAWSLAAPPPASASAKTPLPRDPTDH
jgi:serine/threonine protein kinase